MIGNRVLTFISVYAQQRSLSADTKVLLFDQLQKAVTKIPGSEILIPVDDRNGHVGYQEGQKWASVGYQEGHG